jgi:hypothetical protein
MAMHRFMTRFSRPAGTNKPFEFRSRRSIEVVSKPVYLGNHAPTDHFAPVAQTWVTAEELYDNRRRRRTS